jgi:MarR family transcriptional regulator for hemolysin
MTMPARDSTDLENHIFFLCTQVVARRDRAISEAVRRFGMQPTEWRTLGTLIQCGPLSMLELAQWTSYDRTRLTRLLHAMEDKQWVSRSGDAKDGRAVIVSIAPKGRRMYARAEAVIDTLTDDILSVCSADEIDRLRQSLHAIRGRLIEREQGTR